MHGPPRLASPEHREKWAEIQATTASPIRLGTSIGMAGGESSRRRLIAGAGRAGRDCTKARGQHMLLDHLVCPQQQRLRNLQAQCLSRLQVDDEREPVGLFDWKVARLGALEDLIDVDRRVPEHV